MVSLPTIDQNTSNLMLRFCMRMTKQKKTLYEETGKFKSLFDAFELHSKLKDKKIGLATIYRFLASLEAKGEIHSFTCGGKKVYSTSKENHAHFSCEKCGKLRHIKISNADFLKDLVTDSICHFQIELTGICSECKS